MSRIEWKVETSGFFEAIRDFEALDKSLFQDKGFATSIWNDVFKKISSFVQKRFEEGKTSWKPLTRKYLKWKVSAARRGVQIPVGSFGRRVCKLTAIGRLTNTMYPSATERGKDANIFEIKDSSNFAGGFFRYAIDGNKLPHAVYFDKRRPFFFITSEEASEVFGVMESKVLNKIDSIW